MATPELFIVLHDLALPILSFAALLMAFVYIVFEGREGSAATQE
jgi:hypothetical protein